jgi:hypothetical protein
MDFNVLVKMLEDAALTGHHPQSIHALGQLLRVTAKLSWCIEEQARYDESLSAEEAERQSHEYLVKAFDEALTQVMRS